MNNLYKRKVGLPLLTSACIMLTSSCSEDFQKWEILQGEVKCEYLGEGSAPLPYSGESVLMTVETNGNWRITTPSWVTANCTSGTGNAIVSLDVPKNNNPKKRNGTVTVDFSASEESNIAGISKKSYTISQGALTDGLKIEFPEAYLKVRKMWDQRTYYYVDCSITYDIVYDVQDSRMNELLTNSYLRYTYGETSGFYSYFNLGFYYFDKEFKKIDVSLGTHTIETSGSMAYNRNDIAPGYAYIYAGDGTLLGSVKLGKKYVD